MGDVSDGGAAFMLLDIVTGRSSEISMWDVYSGESLDGRI